MRYKDKLMRHMFLTYAKYQVAQVLALISGHTPLSVSISYLEEAKTAHHVT